MDKADPLKVLENGYTVQLSPTMSTLFVYHVRPEFAGRTCMMAMYMPPASPMPELAPVKVITPGGFSVSRLANQVLGNVTAQHVGSSSLVGAVGILEPARRYNIASFPCEAGQRVGYQVDSIGGLAMNWFQMTYPALGMFMLVN